MKISIVLAEDQQLIRDSLGLLLSEGDEFHIAGFASNGVDGVELCRHHTPDIALLDIQMPVMGGIEAAKIIKKKLPDCRVVLLTTFEEDEKIEKALEAGVDGYLLKDIEPDLFRLALRGIKEGLHIYHPHPGGYLNKGNRLDTVKRDEMGLTERDMAFIKLLTEGLGNKEIAQRENCSEGTVKNRVSSILNKMGLQARTQIAVYAIKNNLVGEENP